METHWRKGSDSHSTRSPPEVSAPNIHAFDQELTRGRDQEAHDAAPAATQTQKTRTATRLPSRHCAKKVVTLIRSHLATPTATIRTPR